MWLRRRDLGTLDVGVRRSRNFEYEYCAPVMLQYCKQAMKSLRNTKADTSEEIQEKQALM